MQKPALFYFDWQISAAVLQGGNVGEVWLTENVMFSHLMSQTEKHSARN